ncbi:hypothetical protein GGI12_003960 [Dipsacomyces acuminosporus]|nr:hypothetical protein GGI12_003960 [Dipsacomyces acuminosporus]
MVSRNASMMDYPSRSPEAHRRVFRRTHSLQSPDNAIGDASGLHTIPNGTLYYNSNHHHHQHLPQSPLPPIPLGMGSPPNADRYHFSPRRKRLSMDSPSTPRRIRRRLFFEDRSDGPEAPEDKERKMHLYHEADETALSIIREAVELGNSHIDLSDLQLESVPDELAELKDLVVLTPGHVLVSDLQLMLSTNRLRYFPMAVCELTNLTTLIISHNRITHLPPEIGNLVSLRELSVAHNRLRVLPLEITKLNKLITLSVFPNPFADPPASAPATANRQQGVVDKAFRSFLSQQLKLNPADLRQFSVSVLSSVPRLADFAARKLPRQQLITLKHSLAQCLESARPTLGRIVGPAMETSDNCVSVALKAQHLVLPAGHECAACSQWFLSPSAELLVWATFTLIPRPVPFKARLCSRSCLYTANLAELLVREPPKAAAPQQ